MIGTVYLVGAGPGDPQLITVKGLRLLEKADAVVYDRLASPDLLKYARPQAILINAGKEPARKRTSQESINHTLVQLAQKGLEVVRLKGGDPFVFGRGGEEALALACCGVPFEVVPGISSAVAVPAYAGIPVTHRHISQGFSVVTGHLADGSRHSVDWGAFPPNHTLVVLMGVKNLPLIVEKLIGAGRSRETPVAIIEQGTHPNQHRVTGTLETIVAKARGIRPPAIIVIGEVVNLHGELDWFEPTLQKTKEPHK